MMPRYAELVYNGFWFDPEREMLQKAIDASQENVTGTVRMKLYKGNVIITGRQSPHSLYHPDLVTLKTGPQITISRMRMALSGSMPCGCAFVK